MKNYSLQQLFSKPWLFSIFQTDGALQEGKSGKSCPTDFKILTELLIFKNILIVQNSMVP